MNIPDLGTSLTGIINFTKRFITWLDSHLDDKKLRLVLADNLHQIPRDAFIEEKVIMKHR